MDASPARLSSFHCISGGNASESAGSVSADKRSEALLAMMDARIVCHHGRVLDALAIYDTIAESVRPIRAGRAYTTGIR
jgi:hypothetical protein